MTLKRTAAAALAAIVIFFTSCAPKKGDPLSYQGRGASVSATLTSDTGTFDISVTLSGGESLIRIDSPETLSGITVEKSGENVTVSSGGTVLPLSPAASARWRDIFGLFSLDAGAVSSIDESGGTVTVGVGAEPERVFVLFDGADVPSRIWTEDGSLSLDIKDYSFTESETGGTTQNGV